MLIDIAKYGITVNLITADTYESFYYHVARKLGEDGKLRPRGVKVEVFAFAICVQGTLTIIIDGKEVTYHRGTFATMGPSIMSQSLHYSDDYQGYYVLFTREFLTETLNTPYFLERFHAFKGNGYVFELIRPEQTENLLALVGDLQASYLNKANFHRLSILRNKLIFLLYEIDIILEETYPKLTALDSFGHEQALSKFYKLVSENIYRERKVSFYAEEMLMSLQQLGAMLKKSIGITPKEYIDNYTLVLAKTLLKTQELSVSEISSLLNFSNIEVFTRFFKRKTGLSPTRYVNMGDLTEVLVLPDGNEPEEVTEPLMAENKANKEEITIDPSEVASQDIDLPSV